MSEYLPHEVMVEIISRLPVKSLLRFRCVCKSWCSLIAEPSFISLHLRHSPSFLLLRLFKEKPFESKLVHCSVHHDDPLLTLSNSSLPLPSPINCHSSILSICHGLLCVSVHNVSNSLILCNPSLRRFLSLPKPFHRRLGTYSALGFDSRNRDYKIVRVACIDMDHNKTSAPAVEIFSLAYWCWRTLPPAVAPVCSISGDATHHPHGFVNGLVHWGAKRRVGEEDRDWYLFVLSFDFKDEVFHEVVLPESLAVASNRNASVTVVGSSNQKALTVYHLSDDHLPCIGSIWVMKEYGVVQSWNKLFHFDVSEFYSDVPFGEIFDMKPLPKALCAMNNGDILLLISSCAPAKEDRLYLLNAEKRRSVYLLPTGWEWDIYMWWPLYAGYYVESLVLLNNGLVPY